MMQTLKYGLESQVCSLGVFAAHLENLLSYMGHSFVHGIFYCMSQLLMANIW
jgi:hypothetical protein